jgi:hypothetical protein
VQVGFVGDSFTVMVLLGTYRAKDQLPRLLEVYEQVMYHTSTLLK